MEVTQKHKQEIERIISNLKCSKNFICHKSGLQQLCRARSIGIEGYIDCLEEEAEKCEFSLPFGEGYFCKCPVRIYIAQNIES